MSDKNIPEDPRVILCDMCTGEDRKPARKTCMKCEISMCVQHLQAHLTTPVLLQTHPLTEPMALCGSTKCPQHGKLLEYYCLDDLTCVCVSCAIEDRHRVHNMKTFSTAHRELKEKLDAEQRALQTEENLSLEKWKKSEREKVVRSGVRLMEAVTLLRDAALTAVQSSVSARTQLIKTSKSSMQAAQKEEDTFRFLQMYSQVFHDVEKAKAVDLRRGLEPGSERDKLLQEMRQNGEKMLKQAGNFWGSLLTLVNPEDQQELPAAWSDLTFHPQTLATGMSLSKDKRKVFHASWLGQCSATLLIRSTRAAPEPQSWMVSLSRDSDWTVGLCDKEQMNNIRLGPVYGLCCEGNQLSSLTTAWEEYDDRPLGTSHRVSSTPITHQGNHGAEVAPRPEVVEVVQDFGSSSLSFFSRSGRCQRDKKITIKMDPKKQNLAPFVQITKKKAPISHKEPIPNLFQPPSVAFTGGERHILIPDPRAGGAINDDVRTTEVVCELH